MTDVIVTSVGMIVAMDIAVVGADSMVCACIRSYLVLGFTSVDASSEAYLRCLSLHLLTEN